LNESWPLNEYDALFDDAVKNNPGYFCYYGDKVNYLLPRWFGKEGDWEAFINKAANNIGGDDGDVLYARLVWDVKRMQVYNYIYEETKISWPRAKHGFEVLHQRYPQSLSITSEYCVECCLNEDVPQMRALFNELGGRVDLRAWLEKDRFETLRGLAFEK
jgi:hypothetical protein